MHSPNSISKSLSWTGRRTLCAPGYLLAVLGACLGAGGTVFLSGCERTPPSKPSTEPPQETLPTEPVNARKAILRGVTIPLSLEGPPSIQGKATLKSLYTGPAKERKLTNILKYKLFVEGVTVETTGGDVRILADLVPQLHALGKSADIEIHGLKVIGPEGVVLLECAQALPRDNMLWDLKGARIPSGRMLPKAQLRLDQKDSDALIHEQKSKNGP